MDSHGELLLTGECAWASTFVDFSSHPVDENAPWGQTRTKRISNSPKHSPSESYLCSCVDPGEERAGSKGVCTSMHACDLSWLPYYGQGLRMERPWNSVGFVFTVQCVDWVGCNLHSQEAEVSLFKAILGYTMKLNLWKTVNALSVLSRCVVTPPQECRLQEDVPNPPTSQAHQCSAGHSF